MGTYSLADVQATRKRQDAWWTVYMVDPIACRLALVAANRTRLTPNAITAASMVLGLLAAVCFAAGQLAAGAIVFYFSFLVDCVDGKIARLKGTGTPFGVWLDFIGDRVREMCCAAGLAYGQYAATGNDGYILLGTAIAVLDLFRYVNAPQVARVREQVRERGGRRLRRSRSRWERRLRRRRVRSRLFSGIEFHAAVFVVAPLLGAWALAPATVAAAVLLLGYEARLVYRMWLFTRQVALRV
ncbi:CDP-alcohol phosphatidyltransferase family protein [Thermoactinospora rubra]|uniref:CDP-alcohol phosphatidyltransferase family protein n=1 Tax=Thermoactinospora rubra TaxID=1088767 RepID=UPI000A0FCF62|nr:CDP-alcohol phosphatidyltransferase family protein [Thermoactinospora rubra]